MHELQGQEKLLSVRGDVIRQPHSTASIQLWIEGDCVVRVHFQNKVPPKRVLYGSDSGRARAPIQHCSSCSAKSMG